MKAPPVEPLHPLYVGPESAPKLPGEERGIRRRRLRQEAKLAARRQLVGPLTEADIPPGSILSDETLAAIRAGDYVIARGIRPPSSPTRSRRPLQLRRAKMARTSRKRNRP